MQTFAIYQGDTFLARGLYRDDAGVPIPLGSFTVSAYLKTRDDRHLPVTYTPLPETGRYELRADSTNWPLGRNHLVIRYEQDGIKRTAELVEITVHDA